MATLLDTSTRWGRGIMRGIANYARTHGGWRLTIDPGGFNERMALPLDWSGDGVIARVADAGTARALRARRIPVVNVSAVQAEGVEVFPRVANSVEEVGRLAAAYFLERGFRHFGYLSLHGLEYAARQRDAFVRAVGEAGCACAQYGVKARAGAPAPHWNVDLGRLGAWLAALPKPAAILAWSSGSEVIDACHRAGLLAPEEVALLSGADDLLCELCHIPISAVRAACERIGYEAAELLDRLMRGGRAPSAPRFIPPLGVITRQSTDTMAVTDRALIAALGFIRENAARPIHVRDVAAQAGVSRRVLERRFLRTLGHTPADSIRRARLERAKALLVETDLPIPDVAEASGFGSAAYLGWVIRKALGVTPLRYRRDARGR